MQKLVIAGVLMAAAQGVSAQSVDGRVVTYGQMSELVANQPLKVFANTGTDIAARNELLKQLGAAIAISVVDSPAEAQAVFVFGREKEQRDMGQKTIVTPTNDGGVTETKQQETVPVEKGDGYVARYIGADTVRMYFSWKGENQSIWGSLGNPNATKAFVKAFMKDWQAAGGQKLSK
jgi:hypothetical protein